MENNPLHIQLQKSSNVFKQPVGSEKELRELFGYPGELVQRKQIGRLDNHCRHFISLSPMLFISTADRSGACDVSPRGDAAGFVHIIDDRHLVIPERPGNRRLDTLRNLLENPNIGIQFVIPNLEETLRVNGRAWVVKDEELMMRMEAHGKRPVAGIGVEVKECFIHCAKAFKRSQLWTPGLWQEKKGLPSIPRMLADHVNADNVTEETVANALKESYEKRLY
ncbi:pyridoxamine 5'-phosphate oxidase family protein [Paenibacillus tarimensis]